MTFSSRLFLFYGTKGRGRNRERNREEEGKEEGGEEEEERKREMERKREPFSTALLLFALLLWMYRIVLDAVPARFICQTVTRVPSPVRRMTCHGKLKFQSWCRRAAGARAARARGRQ